MIHLARFLERFRLPVLLLAILITLPLGYAASRIRIDASMERIFLENDPDRDYYDSVVETFGDDEIIVIAIHSDDILSDSSFSKIRRITETLDDMPEVVSVSSLSNATILDGDGTDVTERPLIDEIPADPLERAQLLESIWRDPLFKNQIISQDGHTAAINVILAERRGDPEFKENMVLRIRRILEAERHPEEIYLAGIPVLTAAVYEAMLHDIGVFMPVTVLMMVLSLAFFFRSVKCVVAPLISVGMALLWTFGILSLLGMSVSIVSTVIPSLLMAIGASYTIYLLEHNNRPRPNPGPGPGGRSPRTRMFRSLAVVGTPIVFSGVTTLAGFGSLSSNPIHTIRELGIVSIIGITCTVLVCLIIVPVTLSFMGRLASHGAPKRARAGCFRQPLSRRLPEALCRWVFRNRLAVLGGSAVVLFFSLLGVTRITVDTDWASLFPGDNWAFQAVRFVGEQLSGERPLLLVIESGREDAMLDPAVIRAIEDIQFRIEQDPDIASTRSFVEPLKVIGAAWSGQGESYRIPDDKDLLAQTMFLLEMSTDLDVYRRMLSNDASSALVFIRSRIRSSAELMERADQIQQLASQLLPSGVTARVTGSMYLLSKASLAVASGQLKSLAIATVIIFGIILGLFRSARIAAISFLPNIIPIVLNLGLMGWMHIPLTVGTSIMASVALGIAVDDTIHFITSYHRNSRGTDHEPEVALLATYKDVGPPMVYTSVVIFLGFLVLSLSSFVPLRVLGMMTALTMLGCLAGDLILLPAILVSLPSKVGGRWRMNSLRPHGRA